MWGKRDWPGNFLFFLLKDISESIGLRNFKPSRLESDFFQVYFHMYFDHQRSFVAYTGVVISKFSSNLLAIFFLLKDISESIRLRKVKPCRLE